MGKNINPVGETMLYASLFAWSQRFELTLINAFLQQIIDYSSIDRQFS